MSKVVIDDTKLTNIANAIREVNGTNERYTTEEMAGAIKAKVDGAFENVIPQYIKTSAETVAKKIQSRQSGDSFSFAFMSDGHVTSSSETTVKSATQAGLALSEINKRCSLDFVVHGGDYTWGSCSETKETTLEDFRVYKKLVGSATKELPNIYVIGNHDDMPYQPTSNRLTQSETFGLIGRNNRVANAVCNAGCNYGYVDFESQRVRVIYLDTEDKRKLLSPNHTTSPSGSLFLNYHNIGREQLDFIADKALDFSDKTNPQKWTVIIVSHIQLNWGSDWWTNPNGLTQYCVNTVKAGQVLNAYRKGTSVQIEFTYRTRTSTSSTDWAYHQAFKTYDFSSITNRPNLFFAVRGDSHTYAEETLDNDIVSIGCPNIVNGREGTSADGTKYTKTADTENGTSFCIITVDRENEKIFADHYGAGYDREWSYGLPYSNLLDYSAVVNDVRLSGTGQEVTQSGWKTTDYISCSYNDVVRLKNIALNTITNDWARVTFYDSNHALIAQYANMGNNLLNAVQDSNGNWIQFTINNSVLALQNTYYMRICSYDITENSIVTINEEIV